MTSITGKILETSALTDRISTFTIGPAQGAELPGYEAGAHITITLPDGQTRAYSLIWWDQIPQTPSDYMIAVQREDDGKGGSTQMHQLEPGDTITFAPPKSDFPVQTDAPAVLLAGGIGVTPLISMAAALVDAGQRLRFHYAGRSKSVMAFHGALDRWLGPAFALHCDDAETALNLDTVLSDLGEAHLYVCGPRGLIDAARGMAETKGIPAERIHFELFEAASDQAGDQPFEVEVASTGAVYTVAAGQTIIEALEDAGVDVMYDCQRGDCGICQCDVVSGTPDHRDVVLSEAERASGEVIQICVSRSKSPRLVLDI